MGVLENTSYAWDQMMDNKLIFALNFCVIASMSTFNSTGVAVTKNASSSQRATIDTSRTVLIWGFFLIYTGAGHETFQWLQLVGFIVLVFGTLIYNEILVIPWGGLNKNTKAARAARA